MSALASENLHSSSHSAFLTQMITIGMAISSKEVRVRLARRFQIYSTKDNYYDHLSALSGLSL